MADGYRILGWAVPSVCMALFAGLVYYQHSTFSKSIVARQDAKEKLMNASTLKAEIESQPVERRYAAADAGPMEETLFLNDLRERALATGVTILNWTSQAKPLGEDPAADPKLETALLKGLVEIRCTMSVTGPYGAVRRFVGGLTLSDRLFVLKDVTWSRSETGTTLNITLSRFIEPPREGEAPVASAPSAQGKNL